MKAEYNSEKEIEKAIRKEVRKLKKKGWNDESIKEGIGGIRWRREVAIITTKDIVGKVLAGEK